MLEIKGLSASYGAISAVHDMELSVHKGSLCVLLGSNGAGKSTTLRSIAGLHRPVTGSITLDGQEISRLPVHRVVRTGLALVPEGRMVVAPLTVEENLDLSYFSGRNKDGDTLARVFFTDDGSTAMECACKMALQYWQLTGIPERHRFVAFDQAYHGDTAGAASLGGIGTFHERFQKTGFDVLHVPDVAALRELPPETVKTLAGIAIEPLIQGAAGMRLWPAGMLRELRDWCDETGVLLIFDEVMTGFGRTGKLFACQHEKVIPDFLALAKGLTGGYLPLAATLTHERIFSAFLGTIEEQKTFYYGHSYCANPLACAAALASLSLFETDHTLLSLGPKRVQLADSLSRHFGAHPNVSDIRQLGLIAAIDIVGENGEAFPWADLTGAKICLAARKHGILTRPVLDTLVFMPPMCVTETEIDQGISALARAVADLV